jgi:hypothetical protein
VLLWLAEANMTALRRLQLAAEEGDSALILIRPASAARQPSPAVLRLALAARTGGVSVRIVKRRGPPLTTPLVIDFPSHHALVCALPARSGPSGIHAGHP